MAPGRRAQLAAGLALALAGASVVGCAADPGRTPAVASTSSASGASDGRAEAVAAQAASEQKALETLAASDPRFAKRYGRPVDADEARAAQMRALLGDDGETVLHEGAIDLFSFGARTRAVDEALRVAARSPGPAGDAAPPGSAIGRPRLERELLERLVGEERTRVDEERDLPRGASALVRGVVETWSPLDAGADGAKSSRDAWVASRLDTVRASLGATRLDRTALLELDDALDPLERMTDGFPEAARALAALRVAIGATPTVPNEEGGWARIMASMRAHLGLALSPTELLARLDRAEKALRADAVARLARAGIDEKAVARMAEQLLFLGGSCGADPASSRVRALAPPPERASICGALQALHAGTTDAARAAAVIALHDETVVAMWSVGLNEQHLRPERVTQTAHPFFGVPMDREARMVRIAGGRPVVAIGAGLAAELLSRDPEAVERWYAFGDAPLDVIEREVFKK